MNHTKSESTQYAKGLEGIIAAESKICKIGGDTGTLHYRGYPIEQLAEQCTFEEVVYLLLNSELPDPSQLAQFQTNIRTFRDIPDELREMIRIYPKTNTHPMELLQAAISYLSGYSKSLEGGSAAPLYLIAQMATIVAAIHRSYGNKEYIEPREDLSHGANFLYMLRGVEPTELEGSIMDKCLTLHAEHSFNASTFSARVVASTLSTQCCCIAAAIGALYGPLHGGANEQVMAMTEEIGTVAKARKWVAQALAQGERIMGMGHRVYKTKDPRAIAMEAYLRQLSDLTGNSRYYYILHEVETVVREHMEKKGKPIYPNVDFFSGGVYRLLEIPPALYTPAFAVARVSGWLAHVLEQQSDNRIFRPKALYVGSNARDVTPIYQRS